MRAPSSEEGFAPGTGTITRHSMTSRRRWRRVSLVRSQSSSAPGWSGAWAGCRSCSGACRTHCSCLTAPERTDRGGCGHTPRSRPPTFPPTPSLCTATLSPAARCESHHGLSGFSPRPSALLEDVTVLKRFFSFSHSPGPFSAFYWGERFPLVPSLFRKGTPLAFSWSSVAMRNRLSICWSGKGFKMPLGSLTKILGQNKPCRHWGGGCVCPFPLAHVNSDGRVPLPSPCRPGPPPPLPADLPQAWLRGPALLLQWPERDPGTQNCSDHSPAPAH